MQAARDRVERDHRGRAWLAWHVEALSRVRQLPKFDSFAGGDRRAQTQTPEELNMNLRMLAAAWTAGQRPA